MEYKSCEMCGSRNFTKEIDGWEQIHLKDDGNIVVMGKSIEIDIVCVDCDHSYHIVDECDREGENG